MLSICKIDGCAKTLINALIDVGGPGGTIVSDAFVSAYPIPLTEEKKIRLLTITHLLMQEHLKTR